jgi:hypothetical protein
VTPSILSYLDAKSRAPEIRDLGESKSARLQGASTVAQPSSLENYFIEQGRSRDGLDTLSQQLFNASLTIVQESDALTDLLGRFGSREALTERAATARNELVRNHSDKLLAALEVQGKMLAEAGIVSPNPADPPFVPENDGGALRAAERNLALCKELTLGADTQSRPAPQIVTELAESIAQLRAAALQVRSNLDRFPHPSDHP